MNKQEFLEGYKEGFKEELDKSGMTDSMKGLINEIMMEVVEEELKEVDSIPKATEETEVALHPPKGTIDITGPENQVLNRIFSVIRSVMQVHNIGELQTPIFEHTLLLQGNYGEEEKLIFNLKDDGGLAKSLRYDHTVPFARYIAQHQIAKMSRFAIGPVFRRDHVSINQGRFRQFFQADVDIAGDYFSMLPDSEVVEIISSVLNKLGINHTILINHRAILDGIFRCCGVMENEVRTVSSSIDKLDKKPWNDIKVELLKDKGILFSVVEKLETYFGNDVSFPTVDELEVYLKSNPTTQIDMLGSGIEDLKRLSQLIDQWCLPKIRWSLRLARGLDYYTGMIFEVVCDDHPDVGSIGGGGRYDNMVGQFRHDGVKIPCIGGSFGVQRLVTILMREKPEEDVVKIKPLVTLPSESWDARVFASKVSRLLRENGFTTLLNMGIKPWIKDVFVDAFDQNCTHLVIIGDREAKEGKVGIKDLRVRREDKKYPQYEVQFDGIIEFFQREK